MNTPKLVDLKDAVETSLYGEKSARLARSIQAGLTVPPGLALSFGFVNSLVSGNHEASNQLRASRLVQCMHRVPIAARSSGINEDSVSASFAGMHRTLLNIDTFDDLLNAIHEIRASAESHAVLEYRNELGIRGELSMAVLLQRTLDSRCAGVMFTYNPLTGTDERIIESSWGLGESVVSGSVVPDYFRVSRTGETLETRISRKDFAIVPRPNGGTERKVLSEKEAFSQSLKPGELIQLHELGFKCENLFGGRLDLEWAFEEDQLYLVQCRPIT